MTLLLIIYITFYLINVQFKILNPYEKDKILTFRRVEKHYTAYLILYKYFPALFLRSECTLKHRPRDCRAPDVSKMGNHIGNRNDKEDCRIERGGTRVVYCTIKIRDLSNTRRKLDYLKAIFLSICLRLLITRLFRIS